MHLDTKVRNSNVIYYWDLSYAFNSGGCRATQGNLDDQGEGEISQSSSGINLTSYSEAENCFVRRALPQMGRCESFGLACIIPPNQQSKSSLETQVCKTCSKWFHVACKAAIVSSRCELEDECGCAQQLVLHRYIFDHI